MVRYMRALFRVVIKNPLVWLALIVCQIAFLAPWITGESTMGTVLGQEALKENRLVFAEENWESGYEGMPADQLANMKWELETLRRAVATSDPYEYAELRAELAKNDLKNVENGSLSGVTRESLESEIAFFEQLDALDDARIYQSYREASTVFYLAGAYAKIPLVLWLLPGLVVAATVIWATRGKRLLAQAPIAPMRARAAQFASAYLLALAGMLLTCAPAAIVTFALNGTGDLAYPVTNVLGQGVLTLNVGTALLRAAALYAFAVLCVLAIGFGLADILPGHFALAGVAVAVALAAYPLAKDSVELMYVQSDIYALGAADPSLADPLVPYSLLAYLGNLSKIAGYANYWPHTEILADARLTTLRAVTVFVAWTAGAAALGLTSLRLRTAFAAKKDSAAFERKDDDDSSVPARDGAIAAHTEGARQATVLDARGLTLAHGKHVVLKGASLALDAGEIVGLVAPNGYGKTTLLEALVGRGSARKAGSVRVYTESLAHPEAFHRDVLYVPCAAGLLYPHLSAADHLELVRLLWPQRVDVGKLVKLCGLEGYLGRPVHSCSSGMRQQIALAAAYCTGARCLLLDEPMNALDPGNVQFNSYVLARLARQGTAVLLSSHILSNLDELCHEILFIEGAGLARCTCSGGSEDIRTAYNRIYGARDTQACTGNGEVPR